MLNDPETIRAAVDERIEAERRTYAPEPEPKTPTKQTAFSSKEILDALGRNEDGDAWLYVELNRDHFRYDAAAGRWYTLAGHFWERDTLAEATRAIDGVIDIYAQEANRQAWQRAAAEKAGRTEDAKRRRETEDALFKRIRALQSVARKENVLTLARTGADSLAIRGDEWDRDPWLLGCLNGVVDLRTAEHRPGRPDDFIKTIAPVEWKEIDEPAPTWERFLTDICSDNHDLPAYLQRLFGYGITGLTNWHVYPIFYGPQGRNGKGTFLETLKFVLGDLAYKARSEILLESRNAPSRGSADADTLALRGKRIVWASETSEGRRLNASRIKELCGGDTLNARAVYGRDPVEFSPSHLLILLTNDRPQAPASDAALWERIHLIPFNIRFVDDPRGPNEKKADHDLLQKLKMEASGVLSWMVKGCLIWQREGLKPPETVLGATREYRKEEDLIERFISDRCLTGPTYETQAGALYKIYQSWASEMGLKPMTGIRFGKEMQTRFNSYQKRHVFYVGIGLLDGE
ncbi:MAG: DNA primase [Deltaproteobacteria bacterium]|nr:DNA primase [Deltaproteobacteria bacterium]